MLVLTRWLKVCGVFGLIIGCLAFFEVQSANGQKGKGPIFIPLDPATSTRPFMPFAPQISPLQNGGAQFGFNGITGTTNSGNNFVGNATGIGGNIGGLDRKSVV